MNSFASPGLDQVGGIIDLEVPAAFDRLQVAIANLKANPGSLESGKGLAKARVEAARAMQQVPWSELDHALAVQALALVRALRETGAYDELFAPDVIAEFASAERNLPGLLAMMFVSPAWRWDQAPLFSEVPNWLWGSYAEWLFATPHRPLLASEADQCAAHLSRHANELARWVECNLESATIRLAAETFIKDVSLAPLAPMNPELRPLAQVRARILMRICDHAESQSVAAVVPSVPSATRWHPAPRSRRLERHPRHRRALRADEVSLIAVPQPSFLS